MGSGLAEVALLVVLTIIVLPCCLFTLLALLDRFERSLAADDTTVAPAPVVKPVPVVAAVAHEPLVAPEPLAARASLMADVETAGGDVVALPVNVAVKQSPAAATG